MLAKGALAGILLVATTPSFGQSAAEFFETKVRPLLAEKCFACHTQTKMGGLEMSSRAALLAGGASGPAVEPKAPERSLLMRAVSYEDEQLKMPPSERLSGEEIKILTKWIDDGAVWPESTATTEVSESGELVITDTHRRFWAFQAVRRPRPPLGVGSPIDRFLERRIREEGFEVAPSADKRTLLRRVYFDLTGLPPTTAEVDAFVADESSDAYRKVVDRLLDSPRYGERWGRHWLDVARYADDRLNSTQDEPYPNAFRYRDWVIDAFNRDMPYDLFIKAQLAGDQLPEEERRGWSRKDLIGGLGMFGLSPKFQDDRLDVVGRGFLGLTVACAQCHDHKFDPIPTKDYYSLLGVFNSTKISEHPLAERGAVDEYKRRKKAADEAAEKLTEFVNAQSRQLVDALAARTEDYILAAWEVATRETAAEAAAQEAGLDAETLERWTVYLNGSPKEHKHLDEWRRLLDDEAARDEVEPFAESVQEKVLWVIAEKKRIELENEIRLGGDKSGKNLRRTEQLALAREDFYLWNDVASPNGRKVPAQAPSGIYYYKDESLDRFLAGIWREHVELSRKRVEALEQQVPEKYPFLHVIADVEEPSNEHVHIRGSADNLGKEVPRRFLQILCDGEPEAFTEGSGRLELAREIASSGNPLTARVMANRVWLWHFGRGLVGTPSDFGMMGQRPTHPELLDYLAARFVEQDWSLKALHREILLTDAYRRSVQSIASNEAKDSGNELLWRANRRRLDVESLRDSLLFVSGMLDDQRGGPPRRWEEEGRHPRTVYTFVSRRRLDSHLGLFDFPNPNKTSARRVDTNTPLQGLFFLNSRLMTEAAEALSRRLEREAGADQDARIERAFRLLYGRRPTNAESALAKKFLESPRGSWPKLAQVWLSSNEFRYVD